MPEALELVDPTASVVLDPPVALPAVGVPGTDPGADGSGVCIWLPAAPVPGAGPAAGELLLDDLPCALGMSLGVVAGAAPEAPGEEVEFPPP